MAHARSADWWHIVSTGAAFFRPDRSILRRIDKTASAWRSTACTMPEAPTVAAMRIVPLIGPQPHSTTVKPSVMPNLGRRPLMNGWMRSSRLKEVVMSLKERRDTYGTDADPVDRVMQSPPACRRRIPRAERPNHGRRMASSRNCMACNRAYRPPPPSSCSCEPASTI